MRPGWAIALALAAASPALADPKPSPADPVEARYTPAYDACLASPDGVSTYGMIVCTQKELDLQNARLNAAYGKVMRSLNSRQKAKLQVAERAWVAFRDAECASYQDEDWGSISRVISAGCVLHMTVQRTMDLEHYPPGSAD